MKAPPLKRMKKSVPKPNGLRIIKEYITKEQEQYLLKEINDQEWNLSLKRRTQHYGYQYDYKTRTTVPEPIGDGSLPGWQQWLSGRLKKDEIFPELPEQLIVNEYEPGQGIAAHVDAKVFGSPIVSLSLGSTCVFRLERPGYERIDLLVEPRTLIIMEGESRSIWKHSIPARKKDNGVLRTTRVSMTYRTLDDDNPAKQKKRKQGLGNDNNPAEQKKRKREEFNAFVNLLANYPDVVQSIAESGVLSARELLRVTTELSKTLFNRDIIRWIGFAPFTVQTPGDIPDNPIWNAITKLTIKRNAPENMTNYEYLRPLSRLSLLRELYLPNLRRGSLLYVGALPQLEKLDLRSYNDPTGLDPLFFLSSTLKVLHLQSFQGDHLEPLSSLINLQQLYLQAFAGDNLEPLSSLKNLKRLELQFFQGDNLEPLSSLINLRYLNLQAFAGDNLEPLSSLKNLRFLNLRLFQSDNLEPLNSLINLKWLSLQFFRGYNLEPLSSLINLRYLDIQAFAGDNLEPLNSLKNLRYLELPIRLADFELEFSFIKVIKFH